MRILFILILVSLFKISAFGQKEITINFTGQINFGHKNDITQQANIPKDTISFFKNVNHITNDGNPTFTTIGTILIDKINSKNRIPLSKNAVCATSDHAKTLYNNGFIAINSSNKNIGAYGFEGLASTADALRKSSIKFAGIRSFCESTTINHKGLQIGFASFGNTSYSPSINDSIKIVQTVNKLDSECDIVIIAFSIDNESSTYSNTTNKKSPYLNLAEKFAKISIDAGADIVYGDGENTPQGLELYNERLIIYGLGNFCTPTTNRYNNDTRCAPIISVKMYSNGTFHNAQIHSFIQQNRLGPIPDKEKNAVRIIKEKTFAIDNESNLKINEDGGVEPTIKSNTTLAFEVLNEGRTHIGKRYRRGAVGPDIFDCSGFTCYIFNKIGIKLNRTSESQYQQGIKVNSNELKPGDLVFFRGSTSRRIGHVGVVVSIDKENKSFKFLHASNRGVIIDDFAKSSYYIRRYVGATRVIGNINNK
jgi:cell wall-associated NlpC family hydrolase